MYKALPLALFLILAACATPQQKCIADASAEHDGLVAQAQVLRGNIDRGYAIHRQDVPYTYLGTCYYSTGEAYPCMQTRTRVQETPVAIDVAEERRKLAAVEARIPAVRARTDAAIAQCRIAHPK